ncbi:hypothetical protein J3F83DRAFT_732419 [Trichoderma novae-zelandiae]
MVTVCTAIDTGQKGESGPNPACYTSAASPVGRWCLAGHLRPRHGSILLIAGWPLHDAQAFKAM